MHGHVGGPCARLIPLPWRQPLWRDARRYTICMRGRQVYCFPSDRLCRGDYELVDIFMLRAFGVTDRGHVRPTNEDCFGIDPDLQLCVIADGMGGHNAGEVASRLAVKFLWLNQ